MPHGLATNFTTVVFADTNIVVYAYGVDPAKVAEAKTILDDAPVISTQVIDITGQARIKLGPGRTAIKTS